MEHVVIETTLGDLICAIADAAREARIEEQELSKVTQLVLTTMLKQRKVCC